MLVRMSLPSMNASPAVASSKPIIMLIDVDLPAPFGPSSLHSDLAISNFVRTPSDTHAAHSLQELAAARFYERCVYCTQEHLSACGCGCNTGSQHGRVRPA